MRTLRTLLVVTVAGAALWIPGPANADGGAFISFDRTHYLPGETAVGEGYIYVPEKHQDLIDRGPFYGYLARDPAAGGDLYLGPVEFERYAREEFELHLSFVVPDVPGEYYLVRVCNDPCTVPGFREPLTGTISVVQTEREAELLTANEKLGYKNYALGRKVRKAERTIEELEAQLAATDTEPVVEPAPEPVDVPAAAPVLAVPTSAGAEVDRPLVEAWALFGIVVAFLAAMFGIGLALILSRRSARIVVPDTIAELEVPEPERVG